MLALISALSLFPVSANAQAPSNSRWSTWLGCWELIVDRSEDAQFFEREQGEPPLKPGSATLPQVCVRPAAGGATFTTEIPNEPTVEQTVIADGTEHPIVLQKDCRGTQRSEWSRDGLMLFTRATLTCSDGGEIRRVSGLSRVGPGSWVDIQAVDVDGQETIRVRRYRRVSDSATTRRARPLTIDEVKEASKKVSSGVLEATLVETYSSFWLSGELLRSLQQDGVPPNVTDLMIALSYPDRFDVGRRPSDAPVATTTVEDDHAGAGWVASPAPWYGGFYAGYYPYFYSPYYYSPYYYPYNYYYPPYSGSSVVVIDNDGPRGTGAARAVDGRGYTRVRSRNDGPRPQPTTNAFAGSPSSSGSSSSSSGSSSGSSSSSSGGSTVSSQGHSSGSSSGGSGRTAQPR
jgi:uncharacterized membrane protein YgcG